MVCVMRGIFFLDVISCVLAIVLTYLCKTICYVSCLGYGSMSSVYNGGQKKIHKFVC